MKLNEIKALAREWQRWLALEEWDLTVRWATRKDLESGKFEADWAGVIYWQVEHKSATILLDKLHCTNEEPAVHTLIHEMLHLRLDGHLPEPRKYDPHYEHALNVLAGVLQGSGEPSKTKEVTA